jgi:hypothetical protein
MPRDEPISRFGRARKQPRPLIPAQGPWTSAGRRQRTEDRFRTRKDRARRVDELHRFIEPLTWDFRETGGDLRILGGKIIDLAAGEALPTSDPEFAEVAIPVVDQERFRRRGRHMGRLFHPCSLTPSRPVANHHPFSEKKKGQASPHHRTPGPPTGLELLSMHDQPVKPLRHRRPLRIREREQGGRRGR